MSGDTALETIEDKSVVATATLEEYHADRTKVLEFVKKELKEGIDYGEAYKGAGKPSLLKPGAEKVCILLQIEPVFFADRDTWTMMGKQSGHVNLVCYLLNQERKLRALKELKELGKDNEATIFKTCAIAEGRGAGSLSENTATNDNSLIKKVEKRALVDAVLRVAGLSEMYTQDGEDTQGAGSPEQGQGNPDIRCGPHPTVGKANIDFKHSGEWQDVHDAMIGMMDDNDWHGDVMYGGRVNHLGVIKERFESITAKLSLGSMNRLYDQYKLLLDTAKKQHDAKGAIA